MTDKEILEWLFEHRTSLKGYGKTWIASTLGISYSRLSKILKLVYSKLGSRESLLTYKGSFKDFLGAISEDLVDDTLYESNLPKILIFDIETAPMLAYVWGRWNQDIQLGQEVNEWFMLCWSAKWLFSSETHSDVLTPSEAKANDDKRITKSLYDLINKADIVVAYNGLKFDIPRMETLFLKHGLLPPAPYKVVDPMYTVKKRFSLSSNKLDSLAMFFGIDVKLHTTFDLWKGCMQGDKASLEYMREYNEKDVSILEEVYLHLLPWLKGHPNISNMTSMDVCPFCGKPHPEEMDAYYYTGVNAYKTYRCPSCGGVFRGRKSIKTEHKTNYVSTMSR